MIDFSWLNSFEGASGSGFSFLKHFPECHVIKPGTTKWGLGLSLHFGPEIVKSGFRYKRVCVEVILRVFLASKRVLLIKRAFGCAIGTAFSFYSALLYFISI